jgi:branched-subunit amino acid transport protein
MTLWTILAMAVATYAMRLAGMMLFRREPASGYFAAWLRYVPIAIFAAIIVPGALAPRGPVELGANAAATLIAALVAFRTRHLLLTIAAGMSSYWLLRALGLS